MVGDGIIEKQHERYKMRKRIFGFGFIASVLLSGAFCYSAALDLPMVTENRRDLEYDKKFLTERMSALNTQLETLVADYKRAPNDSFFYNELRQVRTEIDNTRGHLAGVEKKLLELGRSNTVPEPVQNLAQVGLPVSVEQKESEKKEEESAPQHESKREWSKRFRAQKEAARNIVTALARGGESEEQILV